MRSRSPHRTLRASLRHRLQLLALVLGGLCLLFGLLLLILAFLHDLDVRPRLLRLAGSYGATGAALVVARMLSFTLPHWRSLRRSPSHQRRRAEAQHRHDRAAAGVTPARRDGGVLVLVLLLLGLVSALLVQSQVLARQQLQREQARLRTADLRRAAGEAARAALQRVADDDDLGADHSNETWAVAEEIASPLGITTRTRVDDESRRFDLNNLRVATAAGTRRPDDIAMDLLTLCGDFAPSLKVQSLVDYLDADDQGLHEKDFYGRRDPPYTVPNRWLYGWGELAAVDGWTPALFARKPARTVASGFDANLADCVTLLPLARERPLPVNVNTASRETLIGVLGFERDDLVASVLALRSLKPIRALDTLAVLTDPAYFESVRPWLDVRSRVFRVESRAYADGQSVTLRVLATRGPDGRVDIVQWLF